MKFTCTHCQQRIEAEEEWIGQIVECPKCGQPFTVAKPAAPPPAAQTPAQIPARPVPARPAAPAPRPAAPVRPVRPVRTASRRRRPVAQEGGMGKTILLLLLVAGAIGYGVYRSQLPAPEAEPKIVQHAVATPIPVPKPPKPIQTEIPEATPAPATPAPVAPPDPIAWILGRKDRWPKEAVLLEATEFPVMLNGVASGSTKVPVGSRVQVIEIGPEQSKVRFLAGEKMVANAATTLPQLAGLEMAKPERVAAAIPASMTMPKASPTPPMEMTMEDEGKDAGPEPRVYVGSAYRPAMTDMATKHEEWEKVREFAGFHEHPVGWAPAFNNWGLGKGILSAFKNRYFTAEEDIGGLADGNTGTRWAESVIEQGRKYNQRWKCVAVTVNFDAEKLLADPPKAAADLKEYCKNARRLKIPYYLLFSPVSPSAVKVFDKMGEPYEKQPLWVWVAEHADATGVAIDEPATFISNQRWRERGYEVFKTTRKAGLKFIWMFNGGTDADVTESAARTLKGMRMRPDYWIVSHFHDREYPGTPERKDGTVTSQARVLIEGKF